MLDRDDSVDLILYYHFNTITHWGTLPVMKAKGEFYGAGRRLVKSADKSLRLLFYRGIKEDTTGYKFPLASSDVWCYENGQKIKDPNADYSLSLWGEYGRFEKWFKKWMHWKKANNRSYVVNKMMHPNELNQLNFANKYRINNKNYLIKSAKVTIKMRQISPVELEVNEI